MYALRGMAIVRVGGMSELDKERKKKNPKMRRCQKLIKKTKTKKKLKYKAVW